MPPDFLRYRRGEMNGEEKNSFEKELQKDPFAEEAAEGFASISPEEFLRDTDQLQKRLKTRIVRKYSFIYFRIAASIAVLMVISSIFIIIERNRPREQLSETATETGNLEIAVNQPLYEPASKAGVSEKSAIISGKMSDKSVDEQELLAFEAKASGEYRAKTDSRSRIRPDTSVSALSEVVVTAYGAVRTESEKEDVLTGYIPPQPMDGKSNFDKYIQDHQQMADSTTKGQMVAVVVSFLVHIDGRIDSIRIVRSPGKPFSDEAIRLIKSGPSWKPAEENGKIVEDEVKVRIVFR